MGQELFRVEDKTSEDDTAPIPLCKFCSKPMIRLPKNDKSKAGYACDCEKFQWYIRKDIELRNYRNLLKNLEQKIIDTEQEMTNLGRQSAYYKLVGNAVRKNIEVKNKVKKEKVISFEMVKNNKDKMDNIKSQTENYYFYPYLL